MYHPPASSLLELLEFTKNVSVSAIECIENVTRGKNFEWNGVEHGRRFCNERWVGSLVKFNVTRDNNLHCMFPFQLAPDCSLEPEQFCFKRVHDSVRRLFGVSQIDVEFVDDVIQSLGHPPCIRRSRTFWLSTTNLR